MATEYTAEKIFALAVLTAILLVALGLGVAYAYDYYFEEEDNSFGLVVIEETDTSDFGDYKQILYDPDTLIMYAVVYENDELAMSVLYNSDGTPKQYNPVK